MRYIIEANKFLNTDKHAIDDIDGKTGTNSLSAMSLFEELDEDGGSISKDKDLSNKIISILNSGKKYTTTPELFRSSLSKSKHKDMLTDYSTSELSKMKLFKLPNLNIGYALKDFTDPNGNTHKNGELVAVHNNEPSIGGIGEALVRHAIKNGAMALDHFDTPQLTNLYKKLGFKEYQRFSYDPQYDTDGNFKNKYGEIDVVYRMI